MRLKTQRKVVYAAMGLAVLAMTSGYALADLSLGNAGTPAQQGSETTQITSVAGLTYSETALTMISGFTNDTGCATSPGCSVASASVTTCVGLTGGSTSACASGDFAEVVVLTTAPSTPFSGTVTVTMSVSTALGTTIGAPQYYTNAGGTAQSISLYFDIGTAAGGPESITSVTVVATASG